MGTVENKCAPHVSLEVNTPRGEQSSRRQLALTSSERNGIVFHPGGLIIRVAEVDRKRKTCTECFNFMEFTSARTCKFHEINPLSAGLSSSIHVFLPFENAADWARSPCICGAREEMLGVYQMYAMHPLKVLLTQVFCSIHIHSKPFFQTSELFFFTTLRCGALSLLEVCIYIYSDNLRMFIKE